MGGQGQERGDGGENEVGPGGPRTRYSEVNRFNTAAIIGVCKV